MHLWVHDSASGKLVWDAPIPRSGLALVDMNPRGDQVAIMEAFQSEEGSKIATLQLWDLASGRLSGSSDVPDYREVPGFPHRLTYVRNGSEIALNTWENDLLSMSFGTQETIKPPSRMRSAYHFFDANSLRLLRKTAIDGMSFVDSSRRDIVAADDGNVSFYDVETGSRQILLSGILGLPISARSPDGKRMAIASYGPRQSPELTIWSAESAQRLLTLPIPGRPVSVAFSADGNRLMVVHFGSAGGLSLSTWDATQLPEGE